MLLWGVYRTNVFVSITEKNRKQGNLKSLPASTVGLNSLISCRISQTDTSDISRNSTENRITIRFGCRTRLFEDDKIRFSKKIVFKLAKSTVFGRTAQKEYDFSSYQLNRLQLIPKNTPFGCFSVWGNREQNYRNREIT